MPETTQETPGAAEKAWMYQQRDVDYVTVSPNLPSACAGCRWFESYGSYGQHPECRIVNSYPSPIEATGWCNKFEVMPAEPPQTPMPVVIVDADVTEVVVGAAEVSSKADDPPPDEQPEPDATSTELSDVATVEVPAGIKKLVLNIGAVVEKALGTKSEALTTGFKVIGNHWLAVWSNNFKDRDGEIFTAQAMDDYVARVDMGVVPLPELWVWHGGKNVAIGNADWVARHGHFLMAMGQFYGGEAARAAKGYYTKHAKDTGISHGYKFPPDRFDGKHYHSFNTFEISLLPRGAEANWYTSLEGVKSMELSKDKLTYFENVFGKDHAARILADWDKRGKALEEFQVEFKDFVQPAPADADTANKQAVEAASKAFGELVADIVADNGTVIETVTALGKQSKEHTEKVDKGLSTLQEQYAELQKQVTALQEDRDNKPRRSSKATSTVVNDDDPLLQQSQLGTDEGLKEALPGLFKDS